MLLKSPSGKIKGLIMIDKNILTPLFKTIDKVVFGIKEPNEPETKPEFIEIDTEEEFDVERSIN
ncbi:hypothetical protein DGG96_05715 [Legionella qingyii]|uniref:Uncharacterized protein n=1 Tax=Legionella qingyii TaxID=2184757 RepID=A0A317U600_9GAMM|nr:hypothetical protein [Legionella qingyii]PWY56618.1 hypothetical protein DGG96_05715 [Legionella qingyii]